MAMKIFELWLKYAEEDMTSAKVLLDAELYNMVCFHSQQAVEKALKALLASLDQPIPRTHNLVRLAELCENALGISLELDEEAIMFLNDVYLGSRYPSDMGILPSGMPNRADAQRAYDYARRLYEKLFSLIAEKESSPDFN